MLVQSMIDLSAWPKLEALNRLEDIASPNFRTLPFFNFSVEEWRSSPSKVLKQISAHNLGLKLAVRSCAVAEDAKTNEFSPGYFDSVLNVDNNCTSLTDAIEVVIDSYKRGHLSVVESYKIIVQTQLENSHINGVMLVLGGSNQYIHVDYDDLARKTNLVTSGLAAKHVVIAPFSKSLPSPWNELRRCADDLAHYFSNDFFVEFSITKSETPYVFQVRADRRLPTRPNTITKDLTETINETVKSIDGTSGLSSMADWNPTEILGLRSKPLDNSLYRNLLMDGAWLDGRASIGWHSPSNKNLMQLVAGKPYIKLKQSLESLLPAGLSDNLVNRLVSDRLNHLAENPELHDKIEFELMWSAYSFDAENVRRDLRKRKFSDADVDSLFHCLRVVTRRVLKDSKQQLAHDLSESGKLFGFRKSVPRTVEDKSPKKIAKICEVALERCRKYGTVLFSRQARTAFMFRYIINFLETQGAIEKREIDRWHAQLGTISHTFRASLHALDDGRMSEGEFLEQFGHLRPASYNIESPRYDELEVLALRGPTPCSQNRTAPNNCDLLGQILSNVDAGLSQADFWDVAAGAYKGREEIKFRFSALLSDILLLLGDVANRAGTTKKNIRQSEIGSILSALSISDTWSDAHEKLSDATAHDQLVSDILLPELIISPTDLLVIKTHAHKPSFVGSDRISGQPVHIDEYSERGASNIAGRIVLLDTADPGFEWIFASQMIGVISAYGGAFSHIGIRCAELGIPAAIGCGVLALNEAKASSLITLDPVEGTLAVDGYGGFG